MEKKRIKAWYQHIITHALFWQTAWHFLQIWDGGLTFILWGELPHLWRKALVELVLPGDEGLADCLFPKSQHTGVASHLVHEGLKHHPFSGIRSPVRLHEGFQSGTHPHSASDNWAGGTHVAREARSSAFRLAPYRRALFCWLARGRYWSPARAQQWKTKGLTGRTKAATKSLISFISSSSEDK